MIINENELKENNFLQNYELYFTLYSTKDKKEITYKTKSEVDIIQTNGSYVKKSGKIIGVLKSEKGPIMIIDNIIIDLKENNYEFRCVDITSSEREFIITVNGKIFFAIKYERQINVIDTWYDEDDLDFFAQITGLFKENRLMESYTRKNNLFNN